MEDYPKAYDNVFDAISDVEDYGNVYISLQDMQYDILDLMRDSTVTPNAFCDSLVNFDLSLKCKERATIKKALKEARQEAAKQQ